MRTRARAEAQSWVRETHLARQVDAGRCLQQGGYRGESRQGARRLGPAGKTAGKGFYVEEGRGEIPFGP